MGNKVYPAYARFFSLGEKYVLKKEAKLWAIRAYEHVLFIKIKSIDDNFIDEMRRIFVEQMEPTLVLKGEKYPEKDHMCSYMTIVVISETSPSETVLKKLKRFSYDRGYLFNLRGHCEARIGLACMDNQAVFTNCMGKELKPLLTNIFISLKRDKEEKVS
ncbi:hypothetical protein [Butyrivibrio sp. VCB2006]|uniref:hypothetical protein n=1 Tax=Butyrivibrio sp. VCB2006 TaxID=1280679 RepID=UPI0012DE1260|nr:hypothetical protein [Butyrivibrio sp. VCB2006]